MKPTISDLKHAEANEKFFSKGTMKFFGKQKFSILKHGNFYKLRITFIEKFPRETFYAIDRNTLKVTPINREVSVYE